MKEEVNQIDQNQQGDIILDQVHLQEGIKDNHQGINNNKRLKRSSLFQTKLLKRLWDQNQFLNLILKFQQFKMICKEKWSKKLDVICVIIIHTDQENAKVVVNCFVGFVRSN